MLAGLMKLDACTLVQYIIMMADISLMILPFVIRKYISEKLVSQRWKGAWPNHVVRMYCLCKFSTRMSKQFVRIQKL